MVPKSPADAAGLLGSDDLFTEEGQEFRLGGDVIVAINRQTVREMDDIIAYLVEKTRPGDKVILNVVRSTGETKDITVTLGVRPRPLASDE